MNPPRAFTLQTVRKIGGSAMKTPAISPGPGPRMRRPSSAVSHTSTNARVRQTSFKTSGVAPPMAKPRAARCGSRPPMYFWP